MRNFNWVEEVWRHHYPLQAQSIWWGLWIGAAMTIVLFSPVFGFAFFALFLMVGSTWRRDEPPVLPVCFAYQWLFTVSGPLFLRFFGYYPAFPLVGDIDKALLVSHFGLLSIVLGYRLAMLRADRTTVTRPAPAILQNREYDARKIFWLVVVLFSIDWFVEISPFRLFFRGAQLLYNAMLLRSVFLFLLWFVVLHTRRGYGYAVGALVYMLIPSLASMMSTFSENFFILLVCFLNEWRFWRRSKLSRRRTRQAVVLGFAVAGALACLAVVWVGAIKPTWRAAFLQGYVTGSPLERVSKFLANVQEQVPRLEPSKGITDLVERTSSGFGYLTLVLDRVPAVLPHENGMLTWRAVNHVLMPRVLFPEKESLGSDSWLVQRYAAVRVAGTESQTSVGLGYLAELYIDFGYPGVFFGAVGLGVLLGSIQRSFFRFSPTAELAASGSALLFLAHFMSFEAEIAKLIGGMIQACFVFSLFFFVSERWLLTIVTSPIPESRRATRSKPRVAALAQ